MVFRITRQFRARKGKGGSTGLHPLEDVVLELILVGFLINHPHLVLDTESGLYIVDFHGDVWPNLSLDHKARVVVQGKGWHKARIGTALSVVLFTIAL